MMRVNSQTVANIVSVAFLLLLYLLLPSSCRTVAPDLNYQQLAKASIRLGVDIDATDNHALYVEAAKWIGVPHKIGGTTRRGIDCSGFVSQIYRKIYGKKISGSSYAIRKQTQRVRKRNLKEGDLLFFATPSSRRKVAHVGIYLKDKKFVHASLSKGVIVSSLYEPYYKKYWICGGRLP